MGFLKRLLNLRTKRKDVKLFGRLTTFTDDTVLTVAVADAILADRDYARAIKSYARRRPLRGEDALRNAISLGGDSDTQACIAGGIAEAYYKEIPPEILRQVRKRLSPDLWEKTLQFYQRYGIPGIRKQVEAPGVS